MRSIFFLLASFLTLCATTSQINLWKQFKQDFNKSYENREEENHRFRIFQDNLLRIKENEQRFQNGEVSFHLGITKFADLNQEELSGTNFDRDTIRGSRVEFSHNKIVVPSKIDWRNISGVPAVADQGTKCNASSYFIAVGVIEATGYAMKKILEPLSVQYLIDCSSEKGFNGGCLSGGVVNNLDYIATYGIPSASDYPYEELQGNCREYGLKKTVGENQLGYSMLKDSEDELTKAVASIGPIAISIDGRDLLLYTGGVLNNPNCSKILTYDIRQSGLLVGYDATEDGQEFWIVQFAFGSNWGEDGYARIARNGDNMCGIASEAYYVTY